MTDPPYADLDCTGLLCPLPVIRLARTVGEAPVGATVVLRTDDVAARTDVPAWCRMRGHELVDHRPGAGTVSTFAVRRSH